jgi:hypothetical protein
MGKDDASEDNARAIAGDTQRQAIMLLTRCSRAVVQDDTARGRQSGAEKRRRLDAVVGSGTGQS